MENINQFVFMCGVVAIVFSLILLLYSVAHYLSINIPGIDRTHSYTLYKFGIGEYVTINDEAMVTRMERCGFNVHKSDGYWWSLKIFRIQL